MQSKRKATTARRTSSVDAAAKLNATPQGRALAELLGRFPSRAALAEAIGSSVSYISLCVRNGQISKSGAMLVDAAGIMTKENLRPDLCANDWEVKPAGLPIGAKIDLTGDQQYLLRDLAAHFGSVKSFCQAAKIEVRRFHAWKTRNKISSHGVLKLMAMNGLTTELRSRIKGIAR